MKYETQHLQAYANEIEIYLNLDNGVRYPTEESIDFQNPYNEIYIWSSQREPVPYTLKQNHQQILFDLLKNHDLNWNQFLC